MSLWAISDLHVRFPDVLGSIAASPKRPGHWLAVAGDVGETEAHLTQALSLLRERFDQVLWVPGNHELWRHGAGDTARHAPEKYERLVDLCRRLGVLTPEDPWPVWPGEGARTVLAPMFLLYDYSFRPPDVAEADALAWAIDGGVLCSDEAVLDPSPWPSRGAWCAARCRSTEVRLAALPPGTQTVLINHFPLRYAHAHLPRIPRFSLWCGTKRTEDWPVRFRARAVVYGHLHLPRTFEEDGVTFHEVSLGYPGQWRPERGFGAHLRLILP